MSVLIKNARVITSEQDYKADVFIDREKITAIGSEFAMDADRIIDAEATHVITADGGFRGAKDIPLKPVIDEALAECSSVKKVIVLMNL